jgi:CPA2 family monovalent cation:H+ antiporter-2
MEHLTQILLLLGVAVAVVVSFQRLHIPTSLGYLLVGVILGPHTAGPTVYVPEFKTLAEFGVVFLLFTIGLNYSLPQLHALRHQVLGLGTLLILLSKTLIVVAIVRRSGIDALSAWRTALLLAVGGEFGFALLAIALDAKVIDGEVGQTVLTSVLFSMIVGAFLIRFNHAIASRLAGLRRGAGAGRFAPLPEEPESRVIIGGYGRVGHTIAVLLQTSGVPFVAFDTDPKRVAQGRTDGHQVLFGDISDPELLTAIHVERAALIVLTVDDPDNALRTVSVLRNSCPQVPVIARARDLEASSRLVDAGATHAYPEAIEASLRLGATALRMLHIPTDDIDMMIQDVRDWGYQPVLEDEKSNADDVNNGYRASSGSDAVKVGAGRTAP